MTRLKSSALPSVKKKLKAKVSFSLIHIHITIYTYIYIYNIYTIYIQYIYNIYIYIVITRRRVFYKELSGFGDTCRTRNKLHPETEIVIERKECTESQNNTNKIWIPEMFFPKIFNPFQSVHCFVFLRKSVEVAGKTGHNGWSTDKVRPECGVMRQHSCIDDHFDRPH